MAVVFIRLSVLILEKASTSTEQSSSIFRVTGTGGKTTTIDFGNMGWIDKVIRLRQGHRLRLNGEVLESWNI